MNRTALALTALLLITGCAFLIDRGPEDMSRYTQCQKRGCL